MNHTTSRTLRSIPAVVAATVALGIAGIAGIAPAFAADAMSGPPIDCSKASSMMMPESAMHDSAMHDSAMHDSAMHETSGGSVDKAFAQMMVSHGHAMAAMAKVEVACGKDAKTKALAQKLLDQASQDDVILQDLLKNDAKI